MVCYSEELPRTSNTSNVAVFFKLTYKLRLSYGVGAASMSISKILIDTESGIDPLNPTFLPP